MSGYTLSIDYGTTYSVGVVASDAGTEVLELNRSRYLPSLVLLDGDGELLVGTSAVNQAALNPERVCATPKRLVGKPAILLGGEAIEVQRAIGAVLERLAREASRRFGGAAPDRLVLTYPALWADERLEVLREAARSVGLPEPELVQEPVAAAAHYADGSLEEGATVAVYDLGGGTFDTAVLRRLPGGGFEVAGRPGGDPNLGGEDFDDQLRERVEGHAAQIDPESFEAARQSEGARGLWTTFRREIRQAKEALSDELKYPLAVPGLKDPVLVTRRELETLVEPQLRGTVEQLAATIADAGVAPKDLAAIYLTGGSSSIPLVSTLISEELGVTPQTWGDPKAVVALGAVSATAPAPAPEATAAPQPAAASATAPEADTGEVPPFDARLLLVTEEPPMATIVCDSDRESAIARVAGLLEATPVGTSYGDVHFRHPDTPNLNLEIGRHPPHSSWLQSANAQLGHAGELMVYVIGDEQLLASVRATHGTTFGPHESFLMVHAVDLMEQEDFDPFLRSLCEALSSEQEEFVPAPPPDPIGITERVSLGVPGDAPGFCVGLVCEGSLEAVNARLGHVLQGTQPEVVQNPPGLAWELAIGRTGATPPGEWARHAQARFQRDFDEVLVHTDAVDGPTTIRVTAIQTRVGRAAPPNPEQFDALVDSLVDALGGPGESEPALMTTRDARFGELGAYSLEHPCTLTLTASELRIDTPPDAAVSSFQLPLADMTAVVRKGAGEFSIQYQLGISRQRARELRISRKPWWRFLVPPDEGDAWDDALRQARRAESGTANPPADGGEVVLFKNLHWLQITSKRLVVKGLLGNVKVDTPVDQIVSFKGSGIDAVRVTLADGRSHKFNPGALYKERSLKALEDATGKRRQ
jgi:actin-like ATPase involved in cell morphogenesis